MITVGAPKTCHAHVLVPVHIHGHVYFHGNVHVHVHVHVHVFETITTLLASHKNITINMLLTTGPPKKCNDYNTQKCNVHV